LEIGLCAVIVQLVNNQEISAALADISGEQDATVKHLKLAGLVSSVFLERGIELVVVGGSAIELYTEGAYVSGDIDLCVVSGKALTYRQRQEIMAGVGGSGGPRSWKIAGVYVDILGELEKESRAALRRIDSPYGGVRLAAVEDLIVERVLISVYPPYPPAKDCAAKLIAAGLLDEVQTDWEEVRRLAGTPAYDVWPELKQIVNEQAEALKIRSPYHSDG
jgi:hypothetical protein